MRIIHALIRLHWCAGCSAHFCFSHWTKSGFLRTIPKHWLTLCVLGSFACSLSSADFNSQHLLFLNKIYHQSVKQFESGSGPTKRRAWSGSKLSENVISRWQSIPLEGKGLTVSYLALNFKGSLSWNTPMLVTYKCIDIMRVMLHNVEVTTPQVQIHRNHDKELFPKVINSRR